MASPGSIVQIEDMFHVEHCMYKTFHVEHRTSYSYEIFTRLSRFL
jgi:hypothetical protein